MPARRKPGPAYVYQADAGAWLHRLPARSINLLLTDPPYPSGHDWGDRVYARGHGIGWRRLSWATLQSHLETARRRLRPGGAAMVVVNDEALPPCRDAMRAAGYPRVRVLRWRGGLALGGDPADFHRGGLGRRTDYIVVGSLPGSRLDRQRVISAKPVGRMKRDHYPTEKPEYLGEALARIAHAGTGSIVVDPYCGSGALLVGARRRGATVVGVDRSARAVALAKRRLGLAGSGIVRPARAPALQHRRRVRAL